ncbi:MAG TPA: type II toxin-antitoxin system HicA family toxin [Chloroflexota bacterium]|nr:type II toxin-antitoxin system HicA family toxin [Chloroflexota bacterium]
MSQRLPLCSSREVVRALERAGFRPARRSKGSHQTFVLQRPERKFITVVPLGKKEIPRGTLDDILKLAGLTVEEFLQLLR